jgi:hypothetical protein
MNPDVHRAEQGAAAGSGAAAVPAVGAPAGLAGSAGDLPAAVVRLIRREAYLFDAVGSPVARPPADIQCRLRFFHHTNVSLDQIVAVLRRGPNAGR